MSRVLSVSHARIARNFPVKPRAREVSGPPDLAFGRGTSPRVRISYEKARVAATVDVLHAARPGITVLDSRPGETVLRIEVPAHEKLGRGNGMAGGKTC